MRAICVFLTIFSFMCVTYALAPKDRLKEYEFEDDLKLTDEQKQILTLAKLDANGQSRLDEASSDAIDNMNRRWPNNTIAYQIESDAGYNPYEADKIRDAIAGLQAGLEGCITFKERTNENNFLTISRRDGCWSYLGYIPSKAGSGQEVSIDTFKGCMKTGSIQHRILHAVGLFHENSRFDRDTYLQLLSDNIEDGKEDNFDIYDSRLVKTYDIPYNMRSVMHYGAYYFSRNGQPTLWRKDDGPYGFLGQRDFANETDFLRVRAMYGCDTNVVLPPAPAKRKCWAETFAGNGICDEPNNVAECNYDEGDCCFSEYEKWYVGCGQNCECLDPRYKDNPNIVQKTGSTEPAKCPNDMAPYVGDGYCDDSNNIKACQYDGGDCCNSPRQDYKIYCKDCSCKDPNFSGRK